MKGRLKQPHVVDHNNFGFPWGILQFILLILLFCCVNPLGGTQLGHSIDGQFVWHSSTWDAKDAG